ncbi:unnamed protein product [Plutella xylostella]|uniref:(diamondback moth) hypothetical protein n=1 Tax=Plutella xylostella TaxID=51655 RepID=A0A8S4FAR8_PLUXY|nr:unnamed protein product [Plutella xylostella]
MTASGASDALRERLPVLWRAIEDAHYSYLETDDSPEKIQQRTKLEGYIMEYLSLVPHECKFGLAETGKVFQRTIDELPDFNAYRAGLGWAALARYAANLLAQPWRKEYKTLRGYYKHEIEANMVGAESLLQALGYRAAGGARMSLRAPPCPTWWPPCPATRSLRTASVSIRILDAVDRSDVVGAESLLQALGYRAAGGARMSLRAPPCPDMVAAVSRDALIAHCECVGGGGARMSLRAPPCPDMVAAVSRDALIAHCECAIMCRVWERLWAAARASRGPTWRASGRGRTATDTMETVHPRSTRTCTQQSRTTDNGLPEIKHHPSSLNHHRPYPDEEPIVPMIHPPYMVPTTVAPNMMYQMPQMHPDVPVTLPQCNPRANDDPFTAQCRITTRCKRHT